MKQFQYFYDNMSYGKKYFNKWSSKNSLIITHIGYNDIRHLYRDHNIELDIRIIVEKYFKIIEKM